MKKNILKVVVGLTLMTSLTACGDKFLETDYYKGIDTETALTNVNNISTALNGTYYSLFYMHLQETMLSVLAIFLQIFLTGMVKQVILMPSTPLP